MVRVSRFSLLLAVFSFLTAFTALYAQGGADDVKHKFAPINTAIPSLSIAPDARGGAMGDQETKGDTSKSQAQGGENAAQTKKEQRRNTWTNEDGSIRPISKWSGVSFTDQQKADYVAGKAVKLENVTDKQGFHATMYIKFNPEKGRPYRYDTNPDNAQQVAPSNESRTQVAVNNDGKTNEATKNLREPLQKGQTNPKDARQQQQQEKPQKKTGKGMKM